MLFIKSYLEQVCQISSQIDAGTVNQVVEILNGVRAGGGRLFFVGVGGSASNASHAVNDFRKICGLECYTPTDNVSELSARINDEGWETSFSEWLRTSRLTSKDGVFILSVGGGSPEKRVSLNIVAALKYAKEMGAKIVGVVGRDGGFTKKMADACVVVPTVDNNLVTFHAESFQSVICHLIAAHPKMKKIPTKWEQIQNENIY